MDYNDNIAMVCAQIPTIRVTLSRDSTKLTQQIRARLIDIMLETCYNRIDSSEQG